MVDYKCIVSPPDYYLWGGKMLVLFITENVKMCIIIYNSRYLNRLID